MLLIFTHFAYCPELFDESTIETISFSFFGFAIFFYNFTPITPVARVSHNYFLFHYFCFIIVVVAFSSFLLILSACSNVVHIYHLTYKFGYLNNINLSITTTSCMTILFFRQFHSNTLCSISEIHSYVCQDMQWLQNPPWFVLWLVGLVEPTRVGWS